MSRRTVMNIELYMAAVYLAAMASLGAIIGHIIGVGI